MENSNEVDERENHRDYSKEINVLNGIPYWKWCKLRTCIDRHFARQQIENTLVISKSVLRECL